MRFRIYCRRHFPTNRRTAALKLIRETMKSEKEQLDKMFGVRDWCILLHDGPHNSDRRPRAYGRSEGDHWSLWGYAFGLKRSTFYMHVYADQSATFGPNTLLSRSFFDYDARKTRGSKSKPRSSPNASVVKRTGILTLLRVSKHRTLHSDQGNLIQPFQGDYIQADALNIALKSPFTKTLFWPCSVSLYTSYSHCPWYHDRPFWHAWPLSISLPVQISFTALYHPSLVRFEQLLAFEKRSKDTMAANLAYQNITVQALYYPLHANHPDRITIPALLSDAGISYPVVAPVLDPFYNGPIQLASVALLDKTGVPQKYHVFYRSLPSAPPNLSLFNSCGLRRRGDIVVLKVGKRQDYGRHVVHTFSLVTLYTPMLSSPFIIKIQNTPQSWYCPSDIISDPVAVSNSPLSKPNNGGYSLKQALNWTSVHYREVQVTFTPSFETAK
ncbi:uncharacterized protein LACBIDRAFT_330346 [Laccaria bicolor S238N-H82]|uniref:Predicted protein n=1 Tax=Laccaria bicolor (strain S238N-H82 / ATCC MYA-4686) TaxID=486041 RepID=B0DL07_LACBS|nr:uncharacterized protein LACBIDRAFT_330346 [Laccaria bicolor S238N-H82]EDR04741.1 predicted protein [Laccaria bicolor S238N-H82]|eukprot:XP_001884565.1 predicted protein [Laccaria bicolor S238N-H82]